MPFVVDDQIVDVLDDVVRKSDGRCLTQIILDSQKLVLGELQNDSFGLNRESHN